MPGDPDDPMNRTPIIELRKFRFDDRGAVFPYVSGLRRR